MDVNLILQQLDLMDKTVSQAVHTAEEQNDTIQLLKVQVEELKRIVVNNNVAAGRDARALRPEYSLAMTIESNISISSRKKADEDPWNSWKVCACDRTDCTICNAEREASLAATKWFDSHTLDNSYSTDDMGIGGNTQQNVHTKHKGDYSEPPYSESDMQDEMREVSCLVDTNYWKTQKTSMYIIRLHPTLCVTQFYRCKGNLYACGLITLLFAYKIQTVKPKPFVNLSSSPHYITEKLYDIVSYSLRRGNDIYQANYGTVNEQLGPAEVVLLNGHLGIQLSEDIEMGSMLYRQALASHMMKLELGQILLFITLKNYNVWSVVRMGDTDIVMFDCQSHQVVEAAGSMGSETLYGGIIYHIHRSRYVVLQTLGYAEGYSGRVEGKCRIAVIQT